MRKAEKRKAENHGAPLSTLLRLSGLSLLALGALNAAAQAGDERPKNGRSVNCAALGAGFIPLEGMDGCFKVGGHVRVDAQVMRGTGSLGTLPPPPGVYGDGAAPAAMRADGAGTTRLRMRAPGDILSR